MVWVRFSEKVPIYRMELALYSQQEATLMELPIPIPDRHAAGQALAEALKSYAGRDDVVVLGVAAEGDRKSVV